MVLSSICFPCAHDFIRFYLLIVRCENRASCSVMADRSILDVDPCPDTEKYLDVAYNCTVPGFDPFKCSFVVSQAHLVALSFGNQSRYIEHFY